MISNHYLPNPTHPVGLGLGVTIGVFHMSSKGLAGLYVCTVCMYSMYVQYVLPLCTCSTYMDKKPQIESH